MPKDQIKQKISAAQKAETRARARLDKLARKPAPLAPNPGARAAQPDHGGDRLCLAEGAWGEDGGICCVVDY